MTCRILAIAAAAPLMALRPVASAQPSDDQVRLERSACYGTCPSYVVTIHRDGLVEYDGGRFVKVTGHQTRKIPEEAVRSLFAKFEAAHFFRLAPSYRARITDQVTIVLTVRRGGVVHSVEDYAGAMVGMPPVVSDLERAVDETAGTDAWIGKEPKK
jgi:hypothetical protein